MRLSDMGINYCKFLGFWIHYLDNSQPPQIPIFFHLKNTKDPVTEGTRLWGKTVNRIN